jgi:hypothetical protein
MGRHRRQHERGGPSGRAAVSTAAALGFGAMQFAGVATAAPAASPAPAESSAADPASDSTTDSASDSGSDSGTDGVGGTSCTDERIKACVDLSEDRAWLLDGHGETLGAPVTVNHGSEGEETPTGSFVIQRKDQYHKSKEYGGASMPYALFFDGEGRAFHEGNPDRPSAGCVRLAHDDAKRFFDYLEVYDRVEIVE